MRRNLESQAGLRALAAGRMGAVGLLALISLPGPVRADVVTDWNLTTLQAAVAASPNQRQQRVAAMLDAARSASLSQIPDGPMKEEGLAVGEAVADQIVTLRSTDGSDVDGTYTFGSGPGEYQRTPPTFGNPSVPAWRFVKPFVLKRGDQFRPEGPPSVDSDEYAADFNETKRLGRVDSAERTAEQT